MLPALRRRRGITYLHGGRLSLLHSVDFLWAGPVLVPCRHLPSVWYVGVGIELSRGH